MPRQKAPRARSRMGMGTDAALLAAKRAHARIQARRVTTVLIVLLPINAVGAMVVGV